MGPAGEFHAAILPFLPGLGFCKARALVAKLKQQGAGLRNREEMKEALELGDSVFQNCNAFLSGRGGAA